MENVYHRAMFSRALGATLVVASGLFVDLSGLGSGLASAFYMAGVSIAAKLPGTRPAVGTALAASTLLGVAALFVNPGHALDRVGCALLIAIAAKVCVSAKQASEKLARKQSQQRESETEESTRLVEVLERLRLEGKRRRDAEAALRESQEHFNLAVIGSRDGIWDWFDVEREQEWWSPSFYHLLGYEPGEIESNLSTFREILHPEDTEGTFRAVEDHLAGRGEFDVEYRLRSKAQGYRWFRARGRAFRGHGEQPTRMTGTVSDIHDRKLAEQAAERSSQRFERAVRGTSDGLWEWKVGTDEAWYAPRFKELLGYTDDPLFNSFTAFESRIHPDDHDVAMDAIQRHLDQGEPLDCEHRLLTQANEYRWYRVRGAAEREESGRAIRLAGSLQDVTASKLQYFELEYAQQTTERQALALKQQSEDLADARDAALASARLKSEFLAMMSHEIRTPMNGVIGMTGLLLDTDLDPEQRDCAEAIRHSADSLLAIINDILDFSKIEAGRLTFEILDFDLAETVEGAVELLAGQTFGKGVELAVLFSPGVPRRLRGDPGRLRQVLVNLVGNAAKFTDQGEIVVRVDQASEDENGWKLHFTIDDTGIGLSKDQQGLLFEPFIQVDGGTTRKYGGTGLGLAISKQLTQMMKGEIGVQSRPEGGSTFWFTALFGKVEMAAETFCELPIPPQRVLVVAPRRIVAQVVEGSVSGSNVAVQWASGIDEAIAILRNKKLKSGPWTVLLDASFDPCEIAELTNLLREPGFAEDARLIILRPLNTKLPRDLMSFADLTLTKPLKQSHLIHGLRSADRPPRNTAWPAQGAKSSNGKRKTRVLVADDNVINQKVALRMLDKLGYSADAVANGLEAVEAHHRIGYDLILMDWHMPEMDGLQATREIRSGPRNPTTPIIALTASVLAADRARCSEAGMDDFLQKPVDFTVLAETLDRWHKTSRSTHVESEIRIS